MNTTFEQLRAVGVPVTHSCELVGRSRATHYRQAKAPVLGPKPARAVPDNGQALTCSEKEAVLELLACEEYADLSIGQLWHRELDKGNYICSLSSMYRIARGAGLTGERRRRATHPPKVKPELVADGPSQVWTWDITKLKGPSKGVWYQLYVLIDIFSRFNPAWLISEVEDSDLAADFIDEAIARNGIVPHTVHGGRGAAMTSQPVSALLADLGLTRSHSRPKTSNDNPFSEAQFKTLKYLPNFPKQFESIQHAREFCEGFFYEYNYAFLHSGIAWHTPASVHFGTAGVVDQARQNTLNKAYQDNPQRFGRRPRPPAMPDASWINKPSDQLTTT